MKSILLSKLLFFFFFFCGCSNDRQVIQNLRTFSKLYGYIKYFHPSDEASLIDWDAFAVDGVEKVKNAKNNEELEEILKKLFYPVAPTIQIYKIGQKPEPLKLPADTTGLKIVTWQHYGLGNNDEKYGYKSIRTNRHSDFENNDFICYQVLNAVEYQNKEIILNLKVKSEFNNSKSYYIFWSSNFKFENNKYDNLVYKSDTIRLNGFKESEIKMHINSDATNINAGFTFHGQGKILIDDFQFLIKKDGKYQEVEIPNSGFEENNSKGKPLDWILKGDSYKVSPNTNNPIISKASLEINSKGNFISGQIFDTIPSLDNILDKDLGNGLRCLLPLALLSDSNGTIGKNLKYPFDSSKYKMIYRDTTFTKKDYSINDVNVRFADIIITWNVMQHFYPNFEYLSLNWDESLKKALEKASKDTDISELVKTLEMMLEPLQDSHISVNFFGKYQNGTMPFLLDWIDGNIIVKKTLDTINIKQGDVLTYIDNNEVLKLLEEREKLIPGSEQWKRWMVFNYGLLGEGNDNDSVKLTIERSNSNKIIYVKRISRNKFWRTYHFDKNPIYLLDSNIYYINSASVTLEDFMNNLNNLMTAKGIIFDLREYPRDDVYSIFSYFTEKIINSPNWLYPEIIYPDRISIKFDTSNWQIKSKRPYLNCKKVFIIGNGTMSSGETAASIIKFNNFGKMVGQNTAGANGNINPFTIPGDITIYFSGMKVLNEDNSRFFVKGIEPDIFVNQTIKRIQEGRDEYLEKALEILGVGLNIDTPMKIYK
ncbi:MAG: hypothetical protein HZB41_13555 [Ignavibacteriae bacterium]|nr:hypothetical protein [Ignavibacteriota bacterium]